MGNVVGSNLFDLLGVLGITALVSPHGVAVAEAARRFDLPFLLAVTVACLPVFITGVGIDRWEGGLFVALYAFYAAQLYVLARAGVTPSPTIAVAAVLGGVGFLSVMGWLRRNLRHPS